MFLGLFGSHKRTVLQFYIDSSSVAVVVCVLESDKNPHIIWSKRKEIVFKTDLNFESFQNSTIEALKTIIADCAKNCPVRPHEFQGVLSSPWFVSQTRVAQVKSDKPFLPDKAFIKRVINSEVEQFQSERIKAGDVILGKENVIIEVQNMRIDLNGYESRALDRQKVVDFKASVYISMSSKAILESFRNVIYRSYHADKVIFHTLPYVAFNTLRDIVPGPDQFMFIDINGEITDLSVVSRGILMETISFPLGYNFLLRRLARTFATDIVEAKHLLEMHAKGELHKDLIGKIETDITYAKDEWLKSLSKVLELSSFDYLLPDIAYVVGHRYTLKYFVTYIESEYLKQFTITNKPIRTEIVTSDLLKNFISIKSGTKSDVFLYLSVLFANKQIS